VVSTLSQSVNEKARAAFDALVDYAWTNIVEYNKSNSDTGETSAEAILHEQGIGLMSRSTISTLAMLGRKFVEVTDRDSFLAAIKRVIEPQLDEYGLDLKWVQIDTARGTGNYINFCPAKTRTASSRPPLR
jgi:hypothetical protein